MELPIASTVLLAFLTGICLVITIVVGINVWCHDSDVDEQYSQAFIWVFLCILPTVLLTMAFVSRIMALFKVILIVN